MASMNEHHEYYIHLMENYTPLKRNRRLLYTEHGGTLWA